MVPISIWPHLFRETAFRFSHFAAAAAALMNSTSSSSSFHKHFLIANWAINLRLKTCKPRGGVGSVFSSNCSDRNSCWDTSTKLGPGTALEQRTAGHHHKDLLAIMITNIGVRAVLKIWIKMRYADWPPIHASTYHARHFLHPFTHQHMGHGLLNFVIII